MGIICFKGLVFWVDIDKCVIRIVLIYICLYVCICVYMCVHAHLCFNYVYSLNNLMLFIFSLFSYHIYITIHLTKCDHGKHILFKTLKTVIWKTINSLKKLMLQFLKGKEKAIDINHNLYQTFRESLKNQFSFIGSR